MQVREIGRKAEGNACLCHLERKWGFVNVAHLLRDRRNWIKIHRSRFKSESQRPGKLGAGCEAAVCLAAGEELPRHMPL